MEDTALHVVSYIITSLPIAKEVATDSPNIKHCLDNSKIEDHYAIIPTANIQNIGSYKLSAEQQNILNMVAVKLLCAVSEPHIYETLKATGLCQENEFIYSDKSIIQQGFKDIEKLIFKTDKCENESSFFLLPKAIFFPSQT